MRTPIDDFVRAYAERGDARLHMPGHKGQGETERYDITEIDGADSLYEASGIIAESEANASVLFGAQTLFSTEGSSQCIRAMLYLAALHAKAQGRPLRILAGRNAHKTFLSAAALLDAEVEWLLPPKGESYLSCSLTVGEAEAAIDTFAPTALYLTTPDYLGNRINIASIAQICRRKGVLLLVDNAHGADLKFLPQSLPPVDLGADLCCDSAHKTLPTLTGGAYLHLSERLPNTLRERAKEAMALFGSTSPSYLILASLDRTNRYLAGDYPSRLADFCHRLASLKEELAKHGYFLVGNEPLKLTIAPKSYGYDGPALAAELRARGIVPEFYDPDHLVLMLTPECDTERLRRALYAIPRRIPIQARPPRMPDRPLRSMSLRQAILSPAEYVPIADAVGRTVAALTVGCPPAVPIVALGETVTEEHLPVFAYYGITHLRVV